MNKNKKYIDKMPHKDKDEVYQEPEMQHRHKQFQFGTNPMEMSAFEKDLVHREAEERKMMRHKYIRGIQGRDGGCRSQHYEEEYEDGPEVN